MRKLTLCAAVVFVCLGSSAFAGQNQKVALLTEHGQARSYTPIPGKRIAQITCRGTSGQTATCNTNCCTSNNGFTYYCSSNYNGTCP